MSSLSSSSSRGTKKKKGKGGKKGSAGGSSAVGSAGTVFAFDRSSSRVALLRDRLGKLIPDPASPPPAKSANAKVEAIHQDFLTVDPSHKAYANVRGILLDPSCSGSGIVNAPDRYTDGGDGDENNDDGEAKKRLESLANFQLVALKHAMSFPQVERIVYST